MKMMMRIGVTVLLLLAASYAPSNVASCASGAVAPPAQKPSPPPKKNPLLKLVEPWPSADVLKERRAKSEALPLFASTDPLPITIAADFRAVTRDRDPNSKKRFDAELRTTRADGRIDVMHVKLGTRGHFRLMPRNCDMPPLRVEFEKDEVKGTVFAGQSWLKLGTYCQDTADYEQYTLKEYLTYKIYNLL